MNFYQKMREFLGKSEIIFGEFRQEAVYLYRYKKMVEACPIEPKELVNNWKERRKRVNEIQI